MGHKVGNIRGIWYGTLGAYGQETLGTQGRKHQEHRVRNHQGHMVGNIKAQRRGRLGRKVRNIWDFGEERTFGILGKKTFKDIEQGTYRDMGWEHLIIRVGNVCDLGQETFGNIGQKTFKDIEQGTFRDMVGNIW